jgi:hypothetical protein
MRDQRLHRDEWQMYFNQAAQRLQGRWSETEVIETDHDDDDVPSWAPLNELSYDPIADVFAVVSERQGRKINQPREIFVFEVGMLVSTVFVRDADGRIQVVRIRLPLLLTA